MLPGDTVDLEMLGGLVYSGQLVRNLLCQVKPLEIPRSPVVSGPTQPQTHAFRIPLPFSLLLLLQQNTTLSEPLKTPQSQGIQEIHCTQGNSSVSCMATDPTV